MARKQLLPSMNSPPPHSLGEQALNVREESVRVYKLDVSTINTPPPFSALQLLNAVDPVMERVEEVERTTEIAPPFPSLHEQLLNVVFVKEEEEEGEEVREMRGEDVAIFDMHTLSRVREAVVMLRRDAEILTLVSFGRIVMLDREREPDADVMEMREEERVDVM